MRALGVPIAVATDCNPGTSPSTSLPLMLNMACTLFRLTPAEALAGVTRHAARALGLRDRGTLAVGQRADIALWNIAMPAELCYWIGGNRCRGIVRAGRIAHWEERMTLCEIERGDSPLVIDVPHAGTFVPDAIAARLTPAARAFPDTDWHVEKLFAFARGIGATLLVATHSRYVVDLNRNPSGAALYPGADNTELCPTRTFADEPIYAAGDAPDSAEVAARRTEYFEPYHALLSAEIERVRSRHGYAILLDGHSIRSRVPRFFAGRLPDLNLGTADGASCAPAVQSCAALVLAGASDFSVW